MDRRGAGRLWQSPQSASHARSAKRYRHARISRCFQARGLLAPEGAGRFDIAVAIEQFESTQYARREANVDLLVAVKSRNTGQEVYRDRVKVDLVTGSIFALDTGAFGSSDDLQAVAQTALNQAIDQALDKPGFRAALQQQAVPTV